jgi:hypothetical protein
MNTLITIIFIIIFIDIILENRRLRRELEQSTGSFETLSKKYRKIRNSDNTVYEIK